MRENAVSYAGQLGSFRSFSTVINLSKSISSTSIELHSFETVREVDGMGSPP